MFPRSPSTSLSQTKATPSTYSDLGSRHVARHLSERNKSSHSLTFALPQQVCTTPLRQSSPVLEGSFTSIHVAYPGTDGADETTSLSFRGEVANLVPRYANLMHMYTQHESALCIQTMVIKLIYLLFYNPQYSRYH